MPKGKVEATREVWEDRVARWKQSGLTAKEFAAREGIARPGALSWWRYHFSCEARKKNGEATSQASAPLKLIRVEPVASIKPDVRCSASASLEVVCGEHRVVVPAGFDEDAFRRVLTILESSR